MRLILVLLSATFGMHQYTADLAETAQAAGFDVHLVTTQAYPSDRYAPDLPVHTPLRTRGTGFSSEGAAGAQLAALMRTLVRLQPDLVHITGVHLWNLALVPWLHAQSVRVIHTLHDVEPHEGVRFAGLIRAWNHLLILERPELLVHGRIYTERLRAWGVMPERVTYLPLLHLFMGHTMAQRFQTDPPGVTVEPWALFFGRLERYKGIATLLAAGELIADRVRHPWLTVAGAGNLHDHWPRKPARGVEHLSGMVGDQTAINCFARCGVVTLPYTSATQSALVAAAYAFAKPVIVSDSGALAENVTPGVTGWVVPKGDATALAAVLHEALADRDRLAEMGRAGQAWYLQARKEAKAGLKKMYLQH